METTHPVSWQARALNAVFRKVFRGRIKATEDIGSARRIVAKLDRWLARGGGTPSVVVVNAGNVNAEWIQPGGSAGSRTVLYLHGGGFVFSTPRVHARLAEAICRGLDARALMPDYRLAPEHPLPAAHEDCCAAYRWLLAQGLDPKRIAIIGDSAGGLLVLSTLQRIRDAGLPPPACGVMFSPGTDLSDALVLDAGAAKQDPMISLDALAFMKRVVMDPVDASDPAISPCRGSLAGLPPLLIQVGSTEVLLAHSLKAAEMARAAETPVELQVWPEMPHVFQAVSWLPESRRALAYVRDFVARHIPDAGH